VSILRLEKSTHALGIELHEDENKDSCLDSIIRPAVNLLISAERVQSLQRAIQKSNQCISLHIFVGSVDSRTRTFHGTRTYTHTHTHTSRATTTTISDRCLPKSRVRVGLQGKQVTRRTSVYHACVCRGTCLAVG
jgi:hypothetical protein